MMSSKTSWKRKLEETGAKQGLPKVVKIDKRLETKWGAGTFVIPDPKEVDRLMKRVPRRKVTTINEIRKKLAKTHGTTIACPITTGIFARIAAEAASEEQKAGKKNVTPYWRTLKTDGVISEKYPGGVATQRKLLEREDHKVEKKGKTFVVAHYEEKLAVL